MLKLRSARGPRVLAPLVLSVILLIAPLGCGGGGSDSTGPGAPSITLTTPSEGATVFGGLFFKATAENCDLVRFLVDDVEVGQDASAPYEITWNSGTVPNGQHVVKARGEGSGGTAEDSVTITVQNAGGGVIVTVQPATATVTLGGTQQFTAVVTGSTDTAVTWSVNGGSGNGTISAQGLYTAPLVLPSPALVTVLATSHADPSQHAIATVTLKAGSGAVTEAEKTLSREVFNLAHEASTLGIDAVSLAAEAVWGASELAGTGTLTGTLTQTAPGSETWTYSATPVDRLVVAFSGGPTFTFAFTQFDGYLDGTWEDFVDAHQLDFTLRDGASLDIHVVSDRHYVGGAEVPYTWKSSWSRHVTGTALYDGAVFTVDVTHTGTQQGYNEPGYVGLENEERILGQGSSSGASMTLDEYYWTTYSHNSNVGHVVRNWQMTVSSSATLGGVTYAYDTASARWEASSLLNDPGAVNSVREPSYWVVMGTFKKNGTVFGTLDFDGPVLVDTNGPNLILRFTGGQTLQLHTLVPGPGE